MLRQNPDNSCQLQQSLDGGETWTLAFDYSLCIPPSQQTLIDIAVQNNQYVSPFTLNVTFTSQEGYTEAEQQNAYDALCYASQAVTKALFDTAYAAVQSQLTAQTIIAIALGIASAVLIFFDILTFGALTPLMIAVAAAALEAITALQAIAASAFLDQDNIDALSCLMLGNLQNAPVSLESFGLAYTNAECLTADQQAIASAFTQMLQSVANRDQEYQYFLAALAQANAVAQSGGTLASCICGAATWYYELPMDVWLERATSIPVHGGNGGAVAKRLQCINIGTGGWGNLMSWHGNPISPAGDNYSIGLRFEFFVPAGSTLDEVRIWGQNGGSNPPDTANIRVNDGTYINGVTGPSYDWVMAWTGEESGQCSFEVGVQTGGYYVGDWIYRVRLSGTGANPFASCDRDTPNNNCTP